MNQPLSRRNFLKLSAMLTAGGMLAACQPAAPQAETGAEGAAAETVTIRVSGRLRHQRAGLAGR